MKTNLSHDILIIRIEAGRIRTLAKREFEKHFDMIDGNPTAAKLYGKVGRLCEETIESCDKIDTCLELTKEQEKQEEVKGE